MLRVGLSITAMSARRRGRSGKRDECDVRHRRGGRSGAVATVMGQLQPEFDGESGEPHDSQLPFCPS